MSAAATAIIKGLFGKNPDLRDLLIATLIVCGSIGVILLLINFIAQ